jgi:hypothetical protein
MVLVLTLLSLGACTLLRAKVLEVSAQHGQTDSPQPQVRQPAVAALLLL